MNNTYSILLKNTFKDWEASNVLYCHWKGIVDIDNSYQGIGDLDILIDVKDIDKAIVIAKKNGFVEMETVPLRGFHAMQDLIAYDSELDRWIHLHLHTKLITGDKWVQSYHFPLENVALKQRVWYETYQTWIIAPQLKLILLLFRMNAKSKKNWLKDEETQSKIKFVQENFAKYPIEFPESLANYIGLKGMELYQDLLYNKRELLALNIRDFRKHFNPKEFKRMSWLDYRVSFLNRFFYRLKIEFRTRFLKKYDSGRRTLANGGYIVAFIGIDGSGKSSGIARITKFFAKQVNVQTNFLGSGKSGAGFIRKTIMNVIGFKAKSDSHKEARATGKVENTDGKTLRKPPLHYVLWIWLCTLDREKQLKKIQYGLGRGNLVFVDRWLQNNRLDSVDAPRLSNFVEFKGIVGRIARREDNLYRKIKLIPLHQVIKLNITPQISVERKPGELTLEQAEIAIEKLNILQWSENTKVVDVDGTDNLQNVTINLKNAVFQLLKTN